MKTAWLLALALLAGALAPAGAVELRYRFKPGEKHHYRDMLALAFDSHVPGVPREQYRVRSNSVFETVVKKLDGEVATVEVATTENSTERISADGETEKTENKGHPERVRIEATGRIVERHNLGKDKDDDTGGGFTSTIDEFAVVQQVLDGLSFPAEDVEPGHEWTGKVEVNLAPESVKAKTLVTVEPQSTFKRVVIVRGEECAEIVTDFVVPLKTPKLAGGKDIRLEIEGDIHAHLVVYLGLKSGRSICEMATLGAVAKVTMTPPGGQEKMTIHGRLKVNLKTVLEE
ncbi:MAG: hypothetical protein HYU66_06420 [Armatimonadetes bacterium]|nr:hypothetical protein [Armatimonadota bacterium]